MVLESLEVAVEQVGLVEELASAVVLELTLSRFLVVGCHLSRQLLVLHVKSEGLKVLPEGVFSPYLQANQLDLPQLVVAPQLAVEGPNDVASYQLLEGFFQRLESSLSLADQRSQSALATHSTCPADSAFPLRFSPFLLFLFFLFLFLLGVPEFVEFAVGDGFEEADLPLHEVLLEQVVAVLRAVLVQVLNQALQFSEFAVGDWRGCVLVVAVVLFLFFLLADVGSGSERNGLAVGVVRMACASCLRYLVEGGEERLPEQVRDSVHQNQQFLSNVLAHFLFLARLLFPLPQSVRLLLALLLTQSHLLQLARRLPALFLCEVLLVPAVGEVEP